jgi:hypothetical protein
MAIIISHPHRVGTYEKRITSEEDTQVVKDITAWVDANAAQLAKTES